MTSLYFLVGGVYGEVVGFLDETDAPSGVRGGGIERGLETVEDTAALGLAVVLLTCAGFFPADSLALRIDLTSRSKIVWL